MIDPVTYDKSQPALPYPNYYVNKIEILNIVDLDPEEQSVTLFLLLRVEWNDSRISLARTNPNAPKVWYAIDGQVAQDLFFPRLMVSNAKNVEVQRDFASYEMHYFWFAPPHHLEFQQVLKVTIYCSFDFSDFPFDSHECDFIFALRQNAMYSSILLPTIIKHANQQITVDEGWLKIQNSSLPFDIKVSGIHPYAVLSDGYNYSHAGMKLKFERNKIGSLAGGFFGQTATFAVLSTMSYFIDPEVVPGRLGLLITLNLIASNVYSAADAPTERGFSHIEVWMTGIQFTIMLALAEYAIVLAFIKYGAKFIDQKKVFTRRNEPPMTRNWIKCLDTCTFLASLCFMVIFNLSYWTFV